MSLQSVLDSLPEFCNDEILKAFIKGYSIINRPQYKNVVCSISGGSDSDIMLDIVHRVDENKKVTYVWFDTGLEYQATKEHLKYLENKYDISIQRERAVKPIPACVKQYGQPFLSKFVSEMIGRLQRHGFDFKDESYEIMIQKYPNCLMGVKWWCNRQADNLPDNGGKSRFNIQYNQYLKEFLIENPPTFKISNKCCEYAKKKVAHSCVTKYRCDLMITGIRKAEGGIRSSIYKNCYTSDTDNIDTYRPLFWFKKQDKEDYEKGFNIKHSACYEEYGFVRTGCACCPYGRELDYELSQIEHYEPKMHKAVNNVFGDSYAYTKKYKEYCRTKKNFMKGQMTIFDFLEG